MQLQMTLNSRTSYFHIPSAGITDGSHHTEAGMILTHRKSSEIHFFKKLFEQVNEFIKLLGQ